MKNIYSLRIILLLLASIFVNQRAISQTLFGTTNAGGANGGGVIFTYDLSTHKYKVAQQFPSIPAVNPTGNLIQASDGNFYGMASSGALFRIDSGSKMYIPLITFNYQTGYNPIGSLVKGYNGYLYGCTTGGGSGSGTIFRFNITTDSITVLHKINTGPDGSSPMAIVIGKDSNLYGVMYSNGPNSDGDIFKLDTKKDTLIVVHAFTSTTHANSLILGKDGNLYGTTSLGGSYNYGSIFEYTPTGAYITIASFNDTNGYNPISIMQAADSSFYGLTSSNSSNNGTLYKFNLKNGISDLVTFKGGNSNAPIGTLIQANDSNLYGMTQTGGLGQGTIFKCSTSGSFTTLVQFNNVNGDWPNGGVIQAIDGNLYGVTGGGGTTGQGIAFKCSTSGTISTLYNFGSSGIGVLPYGGLVQANDGNLYGTTNEGGALNKGTVYKFTLSDSITTIASLHDTIGVEPIIGLTKSGSTLYGTTLQGGKYGYGNIFSYNTSTHTFDTVLSFKGSDSGAGPYASPTKAYNGNYYGTTYYGGLGNYGVVYKISPSGKYSIIYNFGGGDEANPAGNMVLASDSNLYGTTMGYSGSYGAIFCINTKTDSVKIIASFPSAIGVNPSGNLMEGFDGNLYGCAQGGGANGDGSLFKCTKSGNLSLLASFNGTNGNIPRCGLLQASDSNFYGATFGGGVGNYGVLFKCSPTGNLDTIMSFNNSTGTEPLYATLIEVKGVKINITAPSCTSQTLTAVPQWNGKTPYSYSWSTGATSSSLSGITSAGTYTVLVTDANGISYSASVTLKPYSALTSTLKDTNILCYGDSTGSISDSVSGGVAPYSFLWSNGKTTSSINHIPSGSYSVTVTDNTGCTILSHSTISQPASTLTLGLTTTNVKCTNQNNGAIVATANGGTKPYVYTWNTGATTSSITNLVSGIYCLTVLDSNGCSLMKCDTVKQPVSTLDSVRICMVTVDTASLHNIIVWNNSGLNNIDSFKVYYLNSSSQWQSIAEIPSSTTQFSDTTSINNPNANTVRYCLTGVDSCGNEEPITSSPWQNTMYINNSPAGTFIWSGTGYLIENVSLPVVTYYLNRDSVSNGNWQAIDSVSGTQNKMTDPDYSKYPLGRWYVSAKLNVNGCFAPLELFHNKIGQSESRSNIENRRPNGINELINNTNLSIYPNPVADRLTVLINGYAPKDITLKITDITGRLISEETSELNNNNITINTSSLSAGIYLLEILQGNRIQTTKFIKN